MIVNYNSRVVLTSKFLIFTTLGRFVNFDCTGFIRVAAGPKQRSQCSHDFLKISEHYKLPLGHVRRGDEHLAEAKANCRDPRTVRGDPR